MAISKKGLRKITVNNRSFYWKFNEKIFVTSKESKNSLLIIDFGWYDIWLHANDIENRPDFEPKNVTPKFVSQSILYAINQGWKEGNIQLEFRNGNYNIKE